MTTTTLQPIDPHTETFLSGRYAPIHDEIAVDDLPVDGDLPVDLTGAYLRNGPNPAYPPLGSYTYPLEGDAMIHGVWLEAGAARYANRFVETADLRADQRAGRAVFGGLLTPSPPDRSLLDGDPDPGYPFKLNPSIHVIRHGGRYLALAEGPPPYEITADLDTKGWCDFDGQLPGGIGAHTKIDTRTGEMIVIRYLARHPFLTWAVIGPDGKVTRTMTPVEGLDQGYMIHDFAITERFVVIVVAPLTFNAPSLGHGPLAWRPELGTRIALVPRDGGPVEWVHTESFWAWHYANAYDDGEDVVVDVPLSDSPQLIMGADRERPRRNGFARATIGRRRNTFDLHHLDTRSCEMPRIDDRLIGRQHRYVTVSARSTNPALAPAEHDVLVRYDTHTGGTATFPVQGALSEVLFAPRHGGTDELDGYYLAYATDFADNRTALHIWDAASFPSPPRASIRLPHRVPNGLHGTWLPA